MTLDTLHNVMYGIRKIVLKEEIISAELLRFVIAGRCGISSSTYWNNRKAMFSLGWLENVLKSNGRINHKAVRITGRDLTGEMPESYISEQIPINTIPSLNLLM